MVIECADETSVDGDEPHKHVVTAVAEFAARHLRLHPDTELSVVFVDDDEMARLHVEWMDLPGPTDVLSFPMDELTAPADGEAAEPGILGDLVLAPAFVARQAADHGVSVTAELELLTVHGILHLLGHDHAEPDEEQAMSALTDQILVAYRSQETPS
jgi:probable rRNA maturation factor